MFDICKLLTKSFFCYLSAELQFKKKSKLLKDIYFVSKVLYFIIVASTVL